MRSSVYTAGTFDLFHAGHAEFLRRAALLGDLTVALNTDEFVNDYKGSPPVVSYDDRSAVLESCRYVSHVLPQGSRSLGKQLGLLKPDYLAIGSDWATKDYYQQIGVSQGWLDGHGIILCYIPYTPHISTTLLKQRLA